MGCIYNTHSFHLANINLLDNQSCRINKSLLRYIVKYSLITTSQMHKIFLVRLSGAEHKREIESFKNFEAEL